MIVSTVKLSSGTLAGTSEVIFTVYSTEGAAPPAVPTALASTVSLLVIVAVTPFLVVVFVVFENATATPRELKKAKELPRNTGLLNFVKSWYTIVPTPAPKRAADALIPLPTITGTTIVAAKIASTCWNAKIRVFRKPGLSLTP